MQIQCEFQMKTNYIMLNIEKLHLFSHIILETTYRYSVLNTIANRLDSTSTIAFDWVYINNLFMMLCWLFTKKWPFLHLTLPAVVPQAKYSGSSWRTHLKNNYIFYKWTLPRCWIPQKVEELASFTYVLIVLVKCWWCRFPPLPQFSISWYKKGKRHRLTDKHKKVCGSYPFFSTFLTIFLTVWVFCVKSVT